MTTRQLQQAGLYYRLSVNNKKATTLAPEEAAAATADLAEETPLPLTSFPAQLSVAQSWRVSEEEFIVKIDASPVHMSAAQRMFGGRMQKQPPVDPPTQEDFIAIIDDSPLHRSAAQRMFENAIVEDNDTEAPKLSHAEDWSNFWNNMFDIYKGK
jgi:hypothetical protein